MRRDIHPSQPPAVLASQGGFSLLEVLITILLLSFGLLGISGLQAKIQVAETESFQRAQALLLAQDMTNRISANRTAAASYVTTSALGTGDDQPTSCAALTGMSLDQCEWSLALKGASEKQAGTAASIGAMVGARGCIELVAASNPPLYRVTVVWQGMSTLKPPSFSCGINLYGADGLRRAVAGFVSIPSLI